MANKEESAFLKGVESRLDSLFGEDTKPVKEENLEAPQTVTETGADDSKMDDFRETQIIKVTNRKTEISPVEPDIQDRPSSTQDARAETEDDLQEIPPVNDAGIRSPVSSEPGKIQDKSAFISEIEKRFSAIFGDDDQDGRAVQKTEDLAGQEESKGFEQPEENIAPPPSAVLQSRLKDLKSIVLSLDWEINDPILEQLEDEVNKLYLLYTGDRIIQGLLRILRFVGRYIRVRGANSNQGSINLLMSVYDHLEGVMVSEGMTEATKHIFLMESIKQYQSWVESTDIENPVETTVPETDVDEVKPPETERSEEEFHEELRMEEKPFADVAIDKPVSSELPEKWAIQEDKMERVIREQDVPEEMQAPEPHVDEVKPLEMERPEAEFHEEQKNEEEPFADIGGAEEKPLAEVAVDKPVSDELSGREMIGEDKLEWAIKEQDVSVPAMPAPVSAMLPPALNEDMERTIAAMKDLPPHEAFVYALDELKKTFQAEIDALKEEIRLLKNAG